MTTALETTITETKLNEPYKSVDGAKPSCVLHWDGRLDNRLDLLALLADSIRDDTSNSAIALAAYERWGADGFVHLIGDWSVVIRDHANRALVLASDFAGVRPLYYSVQRENVFWSSRLQAVVDATGISELDEQYMGAFLLYGGCPNRTPYRRIYSVPAGHAVCVSSTGTKIRRFWNLPIGDEVRYRNQHRYEEHLRALFREAVSVRLQTEAPVLAELSGGLDSSSVVSMANHLMRSCAVPAKSLTGVSYVWKDALDEPFIREMESFCGIEGVHISTHDVPLISQAQVGYASPEILQPLRSSVASVARQLRAKVLLTGMNGDLVMGNWFDDSLQLAASLRRLRVVGAFREALDWSKILRFPVYRVLWQAACAALPSPLAPAALYAITDGSYMVKSTETSLVSGLIDRLGLSESGKLFSDIWMQAPPERRKYFRSLSTTFELRTLQVPELWQHLDYTHPFAHRPLVEFLMTVPVNVLCRPGEPRRLMRSALSDLWPTKLRNRRSKGLFNAPWQEALHPLAQVLLKTKHLNLVELGLVDRASVISRLQRLSVGLDCNEPQFRHIVLCEFWLRNRVDRRPFAEIM
ncbi:MAG TPA: asparagine synthase-related protein [Dongiaceae bacterium]|nr:asparagine synthase-related protein [Dongiaceae bacterium]